MRVSFFEVLKLFLALAWGRLAIDVAVVSSAF